MAGGFMFWGLFLALGAIVAGYVVWMAVVERGEPPTPAATDPTRTHATDDDATGRDGP